MRNHTTAAPYAQAPTLERGITAGLVATTGIVTLLVCAIAIITGGEFLTGYASTALMLLNGPLIDGPIVDLGDALSNIQIGQFQQ